MSGDSFLKKALGEDFFESLQKVEIYKPGTRTTIDHEEIRTALQIVPRTLISFLVNHLSPLKVGENKRIQLPLNEGPIWLNATKLERDVYIGSIERDGKIITEFKFRSIPGIGLIIMSAFELYDINKLIDPPKVEESISSKVQALINERLVMHDIVSQVVDKTMAEREALNKLMLMRLTDELSATKEELERERVRLAGCGVAALGGATGDNDVKPGDYGHSASFDDVKRLYDQNDKARKGIANIARIQAEDPNSKEDEYARGLANGLAVADAVVNNKEPNFVDAPKKGSQKLKNFIENRKKPKEFSIQMVKGETVRCPDCGNALISGEVFTGCICLGDDRERKVYIKKSEDGIKIRFGKSWDAENIEMLLEVLRRKRG